jgi:hypothetical protein
MQYLSVQQIYLICAHSGVNHESVENLLRGRRPVKPVTRERIVRAMQRLGLDVSWVPQADLSAPRPATCLAPTVSCTPPETRALPRHGRGFAKCGR